MDRVNAFPDENAQNRQHRNGAARPGLQHEKSNEHSGRWRVDGSDSSIGSAPLGTSLPTLNVRVFTRPGSKAPFRPSTETGRWFVPFDFRVTKKLTSEITMSLEVGVPIIRDYPVYNLKAQLRLNATW